MAHLRRVPSYGHSCPYIILRNQLINQNFIYPPEHTIFSQHQALV